MSRRRDRVADAPLLAWGEALRHARQRRARTRAMLIPTVVGTAMLIVPTVLAPAPRLVWNASASAPIGLYVVQPGAAPQPGDMVIARAPAPYRQLAAGRHYLPVNVPLVKRVVASAGDEICAMGPRIFINGRPAADRRAVDGKGRAMLAWEGCIRLHDDQLFLLMSDPASFDGRYFGLTSGHDVIGKATLLWPR
jgi:conjugative transfer signal peptidase TraF